MDLDENVAEFRKAENDLQGLLDEVSIIIGHSVSEQIKVPTGNPFFGSHSSGGGCGIWRELWLFGLRIYIEVKVDLLF